MLIFSIWGKSGNLGLSPGVSANCSRGWAVMSLSGHHHWEFLHQVLVAVPCFWRWDFKFTRLCLLAARSSHHVKQTTEQQQNEVTRHALYLIKIAICDHLFQKSGVALVYPPAMQTGIQPLQQREAEAKARDVLNVWLHAGCLTFSSGSGRRVKWIYCKSSSLISLEAGLRKIRSA